MCQGKKPWILSSARALCKIAVFSKSIPSREFKRIRQFQKWQSQPGLNKNQIHNWNCTSLTLTDEKYWQQHGLFPFPGLFESNFIYFIHNYLYTIIILLFHTGIKMLLISMDWRVSIRADSLVAITFNRNLTVTALCVVRMLVFKFTAVNCKYKSDINS